MALIEHISKFECILPSNDPAAPRRHFELTTQEIDAINNALADVEPHHTTVYIDVNKKVILGVYLPGQHIVRYEREKFVTGSHGIRAFPAYM